LGLRSRLRLRRRGLLDRLRDRLFDLRSDRERLRLRLVLAIASMALVLSLNRGCWVGLQTLQAEAADW